MAWVLDDGTSPMSVTVQRADEWFTVQMPHGVQRAQILCWQPPRLVLRLESGAIVDALVSWQRNACHINWRGKHYSITTSTHRSTDPSTQNNPSSQKKSITAPLPGRVIALLVATGATVQSGQSLCVIEAMKMQNEILAPRDGVIGEISIIEGQTVETGAVLLQMV